ncbi:hypothetical protein TNCV_525311 [Trichonephila clavipes]|nr:hypothetical protein TNCV_525311 [Trichonephila clavipes]
MQDLNGLPPLTRVDRTCYQRSFAGSYSHITDLELGSEQFCYFKAMDAPYLRGVRDNVFQQDSARPHVPRHFYTCLDTKDVRLLWRAHSPDISPNENI